MNDGKLWKAFSEYIRLRDSNGEGYAKCFTCTTIKFWRDMDCGHGIGRQHMATKYNECNNNIQCKRCNGFEGGQQAIYKEEVEKKYGKGTWEKLEIAAKQMVKFGKFEIDQMEKFYKEKVSELRRLKKI